MADNTQDEAMLREYRATVRNLLQTGDSGIVANSSPLHATIILEEMIRSAQTSFVASAEGMSDTVWTDGVLRLLGEAKAKGLSVRLLVRNGCIPLNAGRLPENLKCCVRKASDEPREGDFLNLAVVDGKAFRIEMDEAEKKAAFCANMPKQAAEMVKWFDGEYASATEVKAA